MERALRYLAAMLLGLIAAAALYTKASLAPASYIGTFTAPWLPPIALFLAVLLPAPILYFRLQNIFGLRRIVLFIVILALIGGALGVYTAVRFVLEQPARTFADLLIVIVGTIIYAIANGTLLFWSLTDNR